MKTAKEIQNDKTKNYQIIEESCALLLIGLWVYTGISKVIDSAGSYGALHNQVFPGWLADVLWVGLPVIEGLAALLLVKVSWRAMGFKLSVVLMTVFTTYILLVLMGVFGRIPCSCGGVLNQLGWWEHLGFNLVFLVLAIIGLKLNKKQIRENINT